MAYKRQRGNKFNEPFSEILNIFTTLESCVWKTYA